MIDLEILKNNLDRIEKEKSWPKHLDPLRGLKGELRRKVLAGLAGHRSGVLTEEESKTVAEIQERFDRKS